MQANLATKVFMPGSLSRPSTFIFLPLTNVYFCHLVPSVQLYLGYIQQHTPYNARVEITEILKLVQIVYKNRKLKDIYHGFCEGDKKNLKIIIIGW